MCDWPSPHQLWALTTSELNRRRAELMRALEQTPAADPAWAGLRDDLAAVIAQQESRRSSELADRGRLA